VRLLTEGKEWKVILAFATPMMLGYLFQQAYQFGDTFVLGRLISKEAMSASGAVFPLLFLVLSSITGFAYAATILIAQLFGANKRQDIPLVLSTVMITSLVGGFIIMVVGLIIDRPIFLLMGLPKEVLPLAEKYFSVLMAGTIFVFGYNSLASIFRGLGDSKTPVFLSILSNIINLGLDFVFVAGFGYGIGSVALATVIAYFIALLTGFVIIRKRLKKAGLQVKSLKFSSEHFSSLLKLGIPNSFQMSFVAIAFFFIYAFVNAFGTDVLAAFSAVSRVNSLAISPAFIFATALTAFSGQNFGAQKNKRISKGLRQTLGIATVIALTLSAVIYFFPEFWVKIFTTDKNVIAIGTSYLVIVSPFYLFFYYAQLIMGVIKGLGDTLRPMRITWFATFGVRVPVAFFGAFRLKVWPLHIAAANYRGIWWGEPFAWLSSFSLSLWLYFKKYRKFLTQTTN
jgi:putative MATE family efflux protein